MVLDMAGMPWPGRSVHDRDRTAGSSSGTTDTASPVDSVGSLEDSEGTTPYDTGSTASGTDSDATESDHEGLPGKHLLHVDGRDLWLTVPSGYDAGSPIPLVIGFHGAGDSGANFDAVAQAAGWTDAAEPAAFALLIPATKSPYGDFAIWSGNPNDDVDEMLDELSDILSVVETLGETWNLDTSQLHAFGFSDGGLFTAVAGMGHSSSFATLTVLGYGWGGSYPLVVPSRTIPVQFACGLSDGFYSFAVDSERYLATRGHDTRMESVTGAGHSFSQILSGVSAEELFAWMSLRPL